MAQARDVPAEIRSFMIADTESVDALLRGLWCHDPTMFEIYRFMHRDWPAGPHLRRTLVAVIEGSVVGAGSLFHNTLSPGRLMVVINVTAAWQRQGIGSALFDALAELSDGRPWLARVAPRRDPAGWAFAAKRGFHPAMRTTTGILDPQDERVRSWAASLPADVPGYQVVPFDAPDSTASHEAVALIHAAIARQYHSWNPIVEVSADQATAIFCGERVLPGSQLCVYAGSELVGAAHLIGHPFKPDAGEAYLVNWGVVDTGRAGTDAVTAALIRHCLEFAAERGLRVGFEVDDAYEPHRSILETAPATDVSRDFVLLVND